MHAEDALALRTIIDESLTALVGTGTRSVAANGSPFARAGVPALGVSAADPASRVAEAAYEGEELVLRSDRVELRISPEGEFVSLIETTSGRDMFTPRHPGNAFHLHHDIPTDWDAWDIDEHYRRATIEIPGAHEVVVEETHEGPVVRIVRAFGDSTIVQSVRLVPDEAAVDITTIVDWHERQRLLKLAFPFAIDAPVSTAETQFGFVTRPTHENTSWDEARFEVVAHRWLHVSDGAAGAAVVNDSTYGHDVSRIPDGRHPSIGYVTQVRQTLLRGPLYPDPESDQGEHTFRSRIVVSEKIEEAVRAAYDLDTPDLRVSGSVAKVVPIVTAVGAGVVVSAVKLAEDGSGDIIVRLHEALGRPTSCRVEVDAQEVHAVDLLERDTEATGSADQGVWEGSLRAFEILTLRGRRSAR